MEMDNLGNVTPAENTAAPVNVPPTGSIAGSPPSDQSQPPVTVSASPPVPPPPPPPPSQSQPPPASPRNLPPYHPPAPMAPPPLAAAPSGASSEKRRSRIWMIAAFVVFCILLGSLGVNFIAFTKDVFGGSSLQPASSHLMEITLEDNGSKNKIAVIAVEGVIYSAGSAGQEMDMPRLIREQLKKAKEDHRVKAVLLKIDSPGGEVLAADTIYEDIEKFQEQSGKPVIAAMGSMAASGGYYVAAPCRWIVAHELTITGSIGVIMHGYNYRGLMNKVGIRPEVIKSGKFKDMLSGEKDVESMSASEKEIYMQEREMVQALINESYDRFKSVIKKGRERAAKLNNDKLNAEWTNYADGRIFSGNQAKKLGFVDEIGNAEVAFNRTLKIAGIMDADLVTYGIPFDLSNLFKLFGKSESQAIKVDWGVKLPELKAGRMYYIAPVVN